MASHRMSDEEVAATQLQVNDTATKAFEVGFQHARGVLEEARRKAAEVGEDLHAVAMVAAIAYLDLDAAKRKALREQDANPPSVEAPAEETARSWVRWNSGHSPIWHIRETHQILGRTITGGNTLCGAIIPGHAIEFHGYLGAARVCQRCAAKVAQQ